MSVVYDEPRIARRSAGSSTLSQLLDAQHTRQHRKGEFAVGGFGPAREESADPVERGVSLLVRHDQYPRTGGDGREEGVGGATLPVRELGLLRRAEPDTQTGVGRDKPAVAARQVLNVSRGPMAALP